MKSVILNNDLPEKLRDRVKSVSRNESHKEYRLGNELITKHGLIGCLATLDRRFGYDNYICLMQRYRNMRETGDDILCDFWCLYYKRKVLLIEDIWGLGIENERWRCKIRKTGWIEIDYIIIRGIIYKAKTVTEKELEEIKDIAIDGGKFNLFNTYGER